MNETQSENTLAQERLHWGIFVVPLVAMLALFVAVLPVMVILHLMNKMVGQLNPQTTGPIGGLLILILVLPEILIGLPLLLVTWVAYLKSNITLTDRRLIFRTGLLSRVTGELPLENIEAIILAEPLLGRILGYGTVTVTSLGGLHFPLRYLRSPQRLHASLQRAVVAAKSSIKP
jgi:uncharacterized membrane protein YdbT with pleckstrin-like domain